MTLEPLELDGTFAVAKARVVEWFEAAYLEALVRRCEGNLSKASRQADVARNHLRELLKKHGLYKPGDYARAAVALDAQRSRDEGVERAAPKLPRSGLVRLRGMTAQRTDPQGIALRTHRGHHETT